MNTEYLLYAHHYRINSEPMINSKYFKELELPDGTRLTDVYVVPKWLIASILRYDDPLLQEPSGGLTDYGKGVADTLKAQHASFSINLERKYDQAPPSSPIIHITH
jgi:hypothetical protein